MQVAQALQHRYNGIEVTLQNHPPTPAKALTAQLLMVVQLAAMGVVAVGQNAAPYLARLGIQLPPEAWRAMQEKKMMILMGAWFIGNTVRQNMLSTGAFEVSFQGTPIFSKLGTGRMPTMAEVVEGLAEAMAANGGDTSR